MARTIIPREGAEPERDAMEGLADVDPVIAEARKRWDRVSEWESPSRERFIDDVKFENGDSDNGYQWPNSIRRSRDVDSRPCLTMNVIRQHNLQISNSARKNKSTVKFVPQGNGATVESALIFQNVARRVEMISSAQTAYTIARNFQIGGGIGWWRLVTDYAGPDTFDQEIFIQPIRDPLSVYMDPDIQQKNGSDANWAFVFDNIPKELFEEEYPEFRDIVGRNPLSIGSSDDDWISRDYIRVAEYFRRVGRPDTLISFVDEQGLRRNILQSKLTRNMLGLKKDPLTKTRAVLREEIEWYLIAGDQVIDSTIWPGKYIPLVRCIGEETVIEGIMDRKGHTRSMKDAQRMLNYNASSQVEFVALQGKTPWIASSMAIEEYESMWNTANTANHSVLIYNAYDDEGQPIQPPQRTTPPTASPAYQAGMDTAFNQMMMVSGQWQNSMGMMGNERTGAAIDGRQAQSETAVFHFQDNYEEALIFTGTQLIDLIPKVYDTKRVLMIQAENDEDMEVLVDPAAQQAFALQQQGIGQAVARVFNPNVGKYAIAPSVGPAYASKRKETADALTLILTQSPALVPIVGDLLMSSLDFDKAMEAAQRMKRLVPPQALGQGPSQTEQQLTQQVQALQAALEKSLQEQGKSVLKLVGKEQMRDVDVYKAQTDRIKALSDQLPLDPEGLMEVIRQLVGEALQTSLSPIIEANANNLDVDGASPTGGAAQPEAPPMQGARKAPDGRWYVPDPSRPGKHLRVEAR